MGNMNENYLNYLLTSSGMTMFHTFYDNADLVFEVKRKEISFIKKEIPKFRLPMRPTWEIGRMESKTIEDITYLQERLLSSLKLPSWFLNSSYGIISDPTPQIFDEFH